MLYREKYNSIFDVYDRINQNTSRPSFEAVNCDNWAAGGITYDEAVQILRKGNMSFEQDRLELQQRVYEFEQSMNIGSTFSGPSHDVAGYTPDVVEHLIGSPTPMLNLEDDSGLALATRPIVKIGICTSLACTCGSYGCRVSEIEPSIFYNRGAAIISLVDYLESQGQRCEVWSLYRGDYQSYWGWDEDNISGKGDMPDYDSFSFEIKLKNASDPWNPSTVVFPLTNTAWIRRINFRLIEIPECMEHYTSRTGELGNRYYGNLNYKKAPDDLEDWDVYFAPVGYRDGENSDCERHYYTKDSALDYLKSISSGAIADAV